MASSVPDRKYRRFARNLFTQNVNTKILGLKKKKKEEYCYLGINGIL